MALIISVNECKGSKQMENAWRICDFVPVVATIAAVTNLIFKAIQSHYRSDFNHPLIKRAAQESCLSLMLKLLPLIGQVYAMNEHLKPQKTPGLCGIFESDQAFYNQNVD